MSNLKPNLKHIWIQTTYGGLTSSEIGNDPLKSTEGTLLHTESWDSCKKKNIIYDKVSSGKGMLFVIWKKLRLKRDKENSQEKINCHLSEIGFFSFFKNVVPPPAHTM